MFGKRSAKGWQRGVRDLRHLLPGQRQMDELKPSRSVSPLRSPLSTYNGKREFNAWRFLDDFEQLISNDNPFELTDQVRSSLKSFSGFPHFSASIDSTPAGNIALAVVCTDAFVPGMELLVLSLLDHHPDFSAPIHVFHDGTLSQFSQARLRGYYNYFMFELCDKTIYDRAHSNESPNQKRIGSIGYLSLEALKLQQYDRVIILDADLLVLGDLSDLWRDNGEDDVRVVADFGALPFLTSSELTDRVIFNSGVMSVPRRLLGRSAHAGAVASLDSIRLAECEQLGRFADQKFWNLHFQAEDVTYLSSSLNTNRKYLEFYRKADFPDIRILHYTGLKPWYGFHDRRVVSGAERKKSDKQEASFSRTNVIFASNYRALVGSRRKQDFMAAMAGELERLHGSEEGGRAWLIGNGPSLRLTDLNKVRGGVKIGFNWIVNHEDFDSIGLDHLIVTSHQFFGSWNCSSPAVPEEFIEKLSSLRSKPTLWFPFFYQPVVEEAFKNLGYQINFVLLEKPFKVFSTKSGHLQTDLYDFLSDSHTGVLTAGLPLALHLGCRDLVLVGCDANYGQADGDYFYSDSMHRSPTTPVASLAAAWGVDGGAQHCYRMAMELAEARGVTFRDATIGGAVRAVPKVELEEI